MTDLEAGDALVERFVNLEIPNGDFTHEMHVAVGWALLRRMPYLDALATCAATLKAMAARAGAPNKFNTTITTAYLALIDRHLREMPDGTGATSSPRIRRCSTRDCSHAGIRRTCFKRRPRAKPSSCRSRRTALKSEPSETSGGRRISLRSPSCSRD